MNTAALQEEVRDRWWDAAIAGDLEAAWVQSDRLLHAGVDFSDLPRWYRPLWDGRPVDGAKVLLRCWRGLGDAVHYFRYVRPLQSRSAGLVVEAPEVLHRLLGTGGTLEQLIDLDEDRPVDPAVVQVECTELPYLFRTRLDTIPSDVPYLRAPPDGRIPPDGRLHVGLCWQGGTYDARRHLPLSILAPLATVPGVRFWQLQRGVRLSAAEARAFSFANPADADMDLAATAATIAGLHLVITTDSMVAHLAGALATPVWTLLHTDPDWRWFRGRTDSPWYPTMRLFRQVTPGDWAGPLRRVEAALRTEAGRGRAIPG